VIRKPEERQQQWHQQQPKPTPTRRWETVPPRNQRKAATTTTTATAAAAAVTKTISDPDPAPTTGSRVADRRLTLRRDESVPLSNKMDEDIASAINRALSQQQAPAHIQIMNARRNAKGATTAVRQQNATAEMALLYRDVIIRAARSVDRGIIDMEGNEPWERLKIHTVPLVRYIGRGTEGLQKMREEMKAENEGITIPEQVKCLSNPLTIREREQRGEIRASSVVFIVKGKKIAQRLVERGVIAAGVTYKVEPYTNLGPNSLYELCCGCDHIESKCRHNQPKCGYCSGPHRTCQHKSNVVGCAAKHGAPCGHTQAKCPNCKGTTSHSVGSA